MEYNLKILSSFAQLFKMHNSGFQGQDFSNYEIDFGGRGNTGTVADVSARLEKLSNTMNQYGDSKTTGKFTGGEGDRTIRRFQECCKGMDWTSKKDPNYKSPTVDREIYDIILIANTTNINDLGKISDTEINKILDKALSFVSHDELAALGIDPHNPGQNIREKKQTLLKLCQHIVARADKAEENGKKIDGAYNSLKNAANPDNKKSQSVNANYVLLKDGTQIYKNEDGSEVKITKPNGEIICYSKEGIKVIVKNDNKYEHNKQICYDYSGKNKPTDYNFDEILKMADEAYKIAGNNY